MRIPHYDPALSEPYCSAFVSSSLWVALTLHDSEQMDLGVSEESITDFLLLRLGMSLKNKIVIKKFSRQDESKTGADWEWWFVDDSKVFGLRVQAKRLKTDGKQRCYRELKSGQAKKLIQRAESERPACFPIYCFYNPPIFPDLFWQPDCWLAMMPGPCGCTIADARFVQKALTAGKKDLATILPGSCPLWCLVCCCRSWISQPVKGIADVAAAAALNIQKRAQDAAGSQELPYEPGPVPEAISRDRLPRYVSRLMNPDLKEEPMEEPIGLQGVVVFSGQG
ncbi:MAG TPA: DUF6615 family protein [Terriglobia bacterium]|nr:DUF6615 family protein [Terriglobia bacterium]